ncbi:transmembrane protein 154 isoform X3 [Thalassophryne amazonica]|uniref:transmembrane protein 154 isoform X3 n=1 Tax=Thalassophryne amazonica TaxID=390379 RepID=UPI001472532E|nr:transmembrane protein 154 isoform X3 [Thalassophryne amazonica]
MSAFGAGTMRASWEATRLLLVLLLTTSTGTVFSESGNGQVDSQTDLPHMETERQELTPDDVVSAKAQTIPESISTSDKSPTEGILSLSGLANQFTVVYTAEDLRVPGITTTFAPPAEGLQPIIILIPVVLVVVIIAMIVCGIVITRTWSKKAKNQDTQKEDVFLEESSSEKVPMPMFEEDVPSVLELEMDELDGWIKKDGEITLEVKET